MEGWGFSLFKVIAKASNSVVNEPWKLFPGFTRVGRCVLGERRIREADGGSHCSWKTRVLGSSE